MICAEFVIRDNKILSFFVEGHAGLAPAGEDILCAAVSAMTQLVINTLTEVYGARLDLRIDEEMPLIQARLQSVPEGEEKGVQGSLQGFFIQMKEMREAYPDHIKVIEKKEKKG